MRIDRLAAPEGDFEFVDGVGQSPGPFVDPAEQQMWLQMVPHLQLTPEYETRALEALAAESPSPIFGLVYGSGFEDRPKLLTGIAKSWPLLGNDEATVAYLKDHESFFGELDRLGVAHPATASKRPAMAFVLFSRPEEKR